VDKQTRINIKYKTLERALLERKTSRSCDPRRTLSLAEISRLLWAADGVNRENSRRIAQAVGAVK
jgi:hypothetical protein